MPTDSISGENSLPGLQTSRFLLCPYRVERRSSGVSSAPDKGTNPIMGALLMTSSKPKYLPSLNTLGVGAPTNGLGGTQIFSPYHGAMVGTR